MEELEIGGMNILDSLMGKVGGKGGAGGLVQHGISSLISGAGFVTSNVNVWNDGWWW